MTSLWRDRYEAMEVAAEGGQGRLYRGIDHLHHRPVALKVRPVGSPGNRDALLAEARLLFSLDPHPGLPLVRDDFFVNGFYVLVIDWVEGASLARLLADRGDPGLPVSTVLGWVAQLGAALDHLHGHRPAVVHGDIKPANAVVTMEARVVLVDFGIASGPHVGLENRWTPGFVAPEVLDGQPPLPASDVFGLAATAYSLLTGSPPTGVLPERDRLDPRALTVIERAVRAGLALEPHRRPGSAGELVERMEAWSTQAIPQRIDGLDQTTAIHNGPDNDLASSFTLKPPVGTATHLARATPGLRVRWRRAIAALASPRVVAIVVLFVLLGGLGSVVSSLVTGGSATESVRLQGGDRYATARVIALSSFRRASVAVLARGDRLSDALAGTYLAGSQDGPVLLTPPQGLAPVTLDALESLHTTQVFIVGDDTAVSSTVDSTLHRHGMRTTRIAAPTHYGTAEFIAQAGGPPGSLGTFGPTALLASDLAPSDAAAAGPLSYQARFPLLYTAPEAIPPETLAALTEDHISHVVVVGDENAVSGAIDDQLRAAGLSVQRVARPGIGGAAAAVADLEVSALGWQAGHVNLARGDEVADAVSGAAHAGRERAPMLLTTNKTVLGDPGLAYLRGHAHRIASLHVFGDPTAVSTGVLDQSEQAAGIRQR